MSGSTERAAALADMFPSVEYAHLVEVLEQEGFDGAINMLLAEEVTKAQDEEEPEPPASDAPRSAWDMNDQLDVERERQRAGQRTGSHNIFSMIGKTVGAAMKVLTPTPATPQVHDIEAASSESGLVVPPTTTEPEAAEDVAGGDLSPTAMSTATAMTTEQITKAAEETRSALEGNEEAEFVEYKRKLDDLAPQTTVITVIGKRGVGKTSIINAMLGRPLLPTKPANLQYIVKNQPGAETWYSVNGAQVPMEEKPFKLKELMEVVVEGAEGVVEVLGPRLFPDDMEIREMAVGEAKQNYVMVVVCNEMSQEEIDGFRGLGNAVLVSVGIDMGLEDVLRIDPKLYLSSLLLQSVGASGPYTGSFNILREKVNTIRAAIKDARDGTTATLLTEISTHTTQKITNLLSIQHACGCDSVDSRPPLSSDQAILAHPVAYTPALPTYQPAEPYTPVESAWQPEDALR